MITKKRAEIALQLFKYALAGVISIIIVAFGYNIINSLTGKACIAEIAKFKIDVTDIGTTLDFGAKEQQSYQVPCDIDEIYFLDLEKADPRYLIEAPLVKDSLETKASNNVFLLKEGKVKSSFSLGPMEIEYPYYKCLVPQFGKVSFFLEGTQKSALMTAASNQPECTLIPVELSLDESESAIDEAVEFACEHCPNDASAEMAKIKQTRENVEIARTFSFEDNKEKTKVEIRLKVNQGSKLKQFRYYESIPKECIGTLADWLDSIEKEDAIVAIKKDPLIVMYFDELKGEKKISYKLNKGLDEYCRQLIKGLGVAQSIQAENGDENIPKER